MEKADIDALVALSSTRSVIIKHDKLGDLTFSIKPMSAKMLAKVAIMAKGLQGLTKNEGEIVNEHDENLQQIGSFGEVIYPMCEVMFPVCCISPKISLKKSSEADTIWIEDLPIDLINSLFEKVYTMAGNTKEQEDAVKK